MTSAILVPALSFHKAHHRLAVALASGVLFLLVAGALVTSNDAGLAVPDWPTSFGHFFKIPPMVGGVKYEHGHRMIAQLIGVLTIIFAIYTSRIEKRSWLRKLAWWGVVLVVAQGVLGGLTVKMFLPWYVSTAHAMLAQTFFALTVLMAVFTSRFWLSEPALPAPASDGIKNWSLISVGAIYLQLFFGAAFRHSGMSFMPHFVNSAFVTAVLLYTAILAIRKSPDIPAVRPAGLCLMYGLFLQLLVGFGAYITRVVWGKNAVQPLPSMVSTTVAHVALGAVLLAASLVLVALVSGKADKVIALQAPATQAQTVSA